MKKGRLSEKSVWMDWDQDYSRVNDKHTGNEVDLTQDNYIIKTSNGWDELEHMNGKPFTSVPKRVEYDSIPEALLKLK